MECRVLALRVQQVSAAPHPRPYVYPIPYTLCPPVERQVLALRVQQVRVAGPTPYTLHPTS